MIHHVISLAREYWTLVDGLLDNEADSAAVDGRRTELKRIVTIREACLAQVAPMPSTVISRDRWQWIQAAEPVFLKLTREQWMTLTKILLRSRKSSLRRGGEPDELWEDAVISEITREVHF